MVCINQLYQVKSFEFKIKQMFFVYILEFILQTKKNKINIIEY